VSTDALDALESRVAELETQLAFQDDLHQRLDETVARQDREILELRQRLQLMAERLKDLGDVAVPGEVAVDEMPPHY
jgi:SlyX protein